MAGRSAGRRIINAASARALWSAVSSMRSRARTKTYDAYAVVCLCVRLHSPCVRLYECACASLCASVCMRARARVCVYVCWSTSGSNALIAFAILSKRSDGSISRITVLAFSAPESQCRRGRGRPSPVTNVDRGEPSPEQSAAGGCSGVGPGPSLMWQERAQSRCRYGQGRAQPRRRGGLLPGGFRTSTT